MPHGKGTYGSKVGRPPRKKYSEGSTNPEVVKDYYKSVNSKAEYFMKYPEAVDDYWDEDMTTISKNYGSSKEKVEQDVIDRINDLELKRGEDPLLEDTKRKGDRGGRLTKNEGGAMEDQMNALAISVEPAQVEMKEEPMLPDEEMEEDYVDYVMQETLSNEDRNYLIDALEKDDRLSMIFDQVVESATEFSGSGPIEGPGNEKSDSIPARLSDGEFVITAKATEEIGADNLMSMMKDAEAAADERQSVAYGGMVEEEDQAVPLPTQGSRAALGNVPNVVKQSRQVEEEMLKSSPRRYYVPVSG